MTKSNNGTESVGLRDDYSEVKLFKTKLTSIIAS